ncbi:hypothetical protein Leryth_015667 [Lithospermum erythrorhizon]|nr:hypothetical protein Leryth_015667 [Lithospermum erythrorhizon]
MVSSNRNSFFQDLKSRELNGFRVRKRPYIFDDCPEYNQLGGLAIEHNGDMPPPMALSFCKTSKYSHILALSDEDGYVGLYNTRLKFLSSSTYKENSEKSKVSEWVAHDNAIFDICWIKEDTNIITASGDQSIKLWDAQEKKCIRSLMGHTGSVKSISSHPNNHDIILSGSRDGSFALWDLRCNENSQQRRCLSPYAMIHEAHTHPCRRRVRRGKASSMSITSVLYLKDEVSVATAGAVDSVIKFWDTRNLKSPLIQTCPQPESMNEKVRPCHGISCLSQDLNGVYISASGMDSRIYLYNVLKLEEGPVKTFSGCSIESFFVKSAISPDAAHILSGSSDGNAYVWQVQKPNADPIVLKSHDGEVTAVDWCPSDIGKVATSSDDFTVRLWNIQGSCYSNSRSPSSIRKRVMVPPRMQRRKLFGNESSECVATETRNYSQESIRNVIPPDAISLPELHTPKHQVEKFASVQELKEDVEKSPVGSTASPSSVLNPPSSLKRKTIRDYFLNAS